MITVLQDMIVVKTSNVLQVRLWILMFHVAFQKFVMFRDVFGTFTIVLHVSGEEK